MASTLNHGTVTVGTTEVQLRASTAGRVALVIQNLGTVAVYVGKTGVTTANGTRIEPGDSFADVSFTGALFAISTSAGQDVRYWEEVT